MAEATYPGEALLRGKPRLPEMGLGTTERVVDRAVSVFAHIGYQDSSIRKDILAPIFVSTGSFYHHFGDKVGLLEAVLDELEKSRRNALLVPLAGSRSFRESAEPVCLALLQHVQANPKRC